LKHLEDILNRRGFTSITARVASDLVDSNSFYDKLGFAQTNIVKGGKTTGRKIILRLKPLNNPTLFDWQMRSSIITDLQLPTNTTNYSPQYLIDLNVIYDVVKKRARTKQAQELIKAVTQNLIRLVISEELLNELARTTRDIQNDPILEVAKCFSTLATPSKNEVKEISNDLAPRIFPERYRNKILTEQDKSDLIHIATAIIHKVDGFITSENKILASANFMRSKYNIDIINPYEISALTQELDRTFDVPIYTEDLNCITTNGEQILSIQKSAHLITTIHENLNDQDFKNSRYLEIQSKNGTTYALAVWTCKKGPKPKDTAYIHLSDDLSQSIASNAFLLDFMCDKISRECSANDISLINLKINSTDDIVIKSLYDNGFRAISSSEKKYSTYKKVALGTVLHPKNWQKITLDIKKITEGIKLPSQMPALKNSTDLIPLTNREGTKSQITIKVLEKLFHPTLYISPNVEGVILPIKSSYSEDLLNTSQQLSFLNSKEAILRPKRVYFGSPNTRKKIKLGTIVLFYESSSNGKGRKSVIAVARVSSSNVMLVDDIGNDLLRQGVVDKNMLALLSPTGKMQVTFFENILPFNKNITYDRLNEIGCNNRTNYVSATTINSEQILTIIQEGLLDE